jgi:hypothetical protein
MLMHRNKKKKLKNIFFFFRDDLVRRIVAVCEQIPPEFLLNAAMDVSGRCRICLRENGSNCYSKVMVT